MTAETLLNIYDHEVQALQRVHKALKERTYKSHDLDAFDREITERFNDVGFQVSVKWFETTQRGVYIPEVEVVGRIERAGEFDHDQMRHEVVNNLLGLPEADAGVIPTGTYTQAPEHGCSH
jgi:hypothetical protein